MEHRQVILSQLFISCGNASTLLQVIDQSLNAITHLVGSLVKRAAPLLIRPPRNRVANSATAQIGADFLGVVATVSDNSTGSLFGSTWASPIDCPLLHQRLKTYGIVALPWCQHKGHRFTILLTADMKLGRETTSGVA